MFKIYVLRSYPAALGGAFYLMGNNSNIDDEWGRGGSKGHFREDVICERSTLPYMKGTKIPKDPVTACLTTDAHQCYSALLP